MLDLYLIAVTRAYIRYLSLIFVKIIKFIYGHLNESKNTIFLYDVLLLIILINFGDKRIVFKSKKRKNAHDYAKQTSV